MASTKYDHVVVVVLENHGYSEIIGNTTNDASQIAPYINTLAQDGVLISNAYGEQHPSQPNYFWLFSGSNQGISSDSAYWPEGKPGPIFNTPNLYTALEKAMGADAQTLFGGYIDSGGNDPITDFYAGTTNYVNRHVPWLGFTNVPSSVNHDFASEFPTTSEGFAALPLLSFVIPALNHDMHDYDNGGNAVNNVAHSNRAINNGDTWLRQNLDPYAQWAKSNNSLLIITFDEDSTADWITPAVYGGNGITTNPYGMTAPNLGFNATGQNNKASGPNQIAMIFMVPIWQQAAA